MSADPYNPWAPESFREPRGLPQMKDPEMPKPTRLNLYLIEADVSVSRSLVEAGHAVHDVYTTAVVAAVDVAGAQGIHPHGPRVQKHSSRDEWQTAGGEVLPWRFAATWASRPSDVRVKLLGTAAPGTKPGVVLASFVAG